MRTREECESRRLAAVAAEARLAADRTEQARIHEVLQTFVDPEERRILTAYTHGSPMERVLDAVRALRRSRQLYTLSADILDALILRFEAAYAEAYPESQAAA